MKSMKTLKKMTVFLALAFTCQTANAILLKTETTNKTFEKAKLVANVYLVNDDKSEVPMKAVSYGLRKKSFMGIPVDVYVLQLLVAHPEKLVKDQDKFLGSLKEAGPIQLHLTFMRDLAGEKISNSFKEGLEANGIKESALNKEMSTILKEVTNIAQFKEGQNFAITVSWSGDNASVYLTDPSAKIITVSGQKTFADQLLSIWFGKTADSRLEDLKKTLIK